MEQVLSASRSGTVRTVAEQHRHGSSTVPAQSQHGLSSMVLVAGSLVLMPHLVLVLVLVRVLVFLVVFSGFLCKNQPKMTTKTNPKTNYSD